MYLIIATLLFTAKSGYLKFKVQNLPQSAFWKG